MIPPLRYDCHCSDYLLFVFTFRVIDTAASQLTKTAITVTEIFIVALGYELWRYLLGHLGVTEYINFSVKQKVGKCFNIFWKLPCSVLKFHCIRFFGNRNRTHLID